MSLLITGVKFQVLGRDGKPLAFGKVRTYLAGTSVEKVTYKDSSLNNENTNPIILNGEGYADVVLDGDYKFKVYDQYENELYTTDEVNDTGNQEWVSSQNLTYITPTQFTVAGNLVDQFDANRAVRIEQGNGYVYGNVVDSSYGGGTTTVNISGTTITPSDSKVWTYLTNTQSSGGVSGVQSVTGSGVNNADPENPIVSGVQSVTGSGVDNTDPENPVISSVAPQEIQAAVTFTFDDGFDSMISLAAEFESRGVFFGMGINNDLDTSTKLTTAQLVDLESRGFEVNLHGATHADVRDSSGTTYVQAKAEIDNNISYLTGKALTPKGFISPYGEWKREYMPPIRNTSNFSYTVAKPLVLQTLDNPVVLHHMSRVNMYHPTYSGMTDLIDEAIATKTLINFYDHDPSQVYKADSATEAEILAVVDYCISNNVNIILPSQIVDFFDIADADKEVFLPAVSQVLSRALFTPMQFFNDIETDILTADASSGLISIKESGMYSLDAIFKIQGSPANSRVILALRIDGTVTSRYRSEGVSVIDSEDAGVQITSCNMSLSLSLTKGQTVEVLMYQDADSSVSIIETYSWANISKSPTVIRI